MWSRAEQVYIWIPEHHKTRFSGDGTGLGLESSLSLWWLYDTQSFFLQVIIAIIQQTSIQWLIMAHGIRTRYGYLSSRHHRRQKENQTILRATHQSGEWTTPTVSSQRLKSCAEDKECRKRNSTHNNLWNYFGKNILTGPNFIKL